MTTGMAAVYLILAFIACPVIVLGIRQFVAWMTYVNNRD